MKNIILLLIAIPAILILGTGVFFFLGFFLLIFFLAWVFGAKVSIKHNGHEIGYFRWFKYYPRGILTK